MRFLAQAQRRCQFVRPMMAWSRQEPDVQQQRFDITDRRDVACLVNVFYDRVRDDDLLGPIFDDVAHVDWATHLPRMYDFWESVLFSTATFKSTPFVRPSGARETRAINGQRVRSLGRSLSDDRRRSLQRDDGKPCQEKCSANRHDHEAQHHR